MEGKNINFWEPVSLSEARRAKLRDDFTLTAGFQFHSASSIKALLKAIWMKIYSFQYTIVVLKFNSVVFKDKRYSLHM